MLPLSLKLQNFLSFQENVPTLHLQEVHVACLCGANGHGKSALLDAITWALWGKARAHKQEHLVHQGQQHMFVDLEFEARGQRYRVIRRYSKKRRQGVSSLELAVSSGDKFQAITGNSINNTQAAIEQLISMDYETFINSAFLIQGRSNLFSMATPSQRKEVLTKVLGLDEYDKFQEVSRGFSRHLSSELEIMNNEINRLTYQISQSSSLTQDLSEVDSLIASIQKKILELEALGTFLQNQITRLEDSRNQLIDLREQSDRLTARWSLLNEESEVLSKRMANWKALLLQQEPIKSGYQAFLSTRDKMQNFHTGIQQLRRLERELTPLERVILQERLTLENQLNAANALLTDELEPRASALPALEEQLTAIQASSNLLESKVQDLTNLNTEYRSITEATARLITANQEVANTGRDIRSKLQLITNTSDQHANCPLCGGSLGTNEKNHIQTSYEEQIHSHHQKYNSQKGEIDKLTSAAQAIKNKVDGLEIAIRDTESRLREDHTRILGRMNTSLEAKQQIASAKAAVNSKTQILDRGLYAQEEQAKAQEIRNQIAMLDIDPNVLEETQSKLANLDHWAAEHQRLMEANSRMPDDQISFDNSLALMKEISMDLDTLKSRRSDLEDATQQLPHYSDQLLKTLSELKVIELQRDALQEKRGAISHLLDQLKSDEAALKEYKVRHHHLSGQVGLYNELGQAFGKSGVQALLIEASIPRLEEEANRLLWKMTEGRMSLKIETQRPSRSPSPEGNTSVTETLDILISDEIGTRPYELFSGGESFRVDFALRIALSKLLAWRSGAPLPTLFIDEGFGTQDAEGRDGILDVIHAIEPDFQQILVITHIDEIKEAFPIRIEVTRGRSGSTFSMQ